MSRNDSEQFGLVIALLIVLVIAGLVQGMLGGS